MLTAPQGAEKLEYLFNVISGEKFSAKAGKNAKNVFKINEASSISFRIAILGCQGGIK